MPHASDRTRSLGLSTAKTKDVRRPVNLLIANARISINPARLPDCSRYPCDRSRSSWHTEYTAMLNAPIVVNVFWKGLYENALQHDIDFDSTYVPIPGWINTWEFSTHVEFERTIFKPASE